MKTIEVVAAVIERNQLFLCVQRGTAQYPYLSEKWEFPGGKMEQGESEPETIQREIREELDMDIAVQEKLLVVEHAYPDFRLTMHTYRCTSEHEPTLHEHRAHRWLAKDELQQLDWAAADVPIVDLLVRRS
jgi:8-oxo-dGTP diphosphatase